MDWLFPVDGLDCLDGDEDDDDEDDDGLWP